jgi:hypothetical protein
MGPKAQKSSCVKIFAHLQDSRTACLKCEVKNRAYGLRPILAACLLFLLVFSGVYVDSEYRVLLNTRKRYARVGG